jgi:signal transduction histidine kinase
MPLLRRTVRLRLTVLYGMLFLLTGAGLLIIAGLVTVKSSTRETAPAPGPQNASSAQALAQAQAQIHRLQNQLAAESGHQPLWHALLIGSLVALAIMAAVSVVVGWFVANRVLRPLRTMTAATRRISADNLHERLAVPGPVDEVKDLADTIDELLERLEGAFAAQRRFVANASHELRTPLATMRASLDVAEAKPEPAPPQTTALAGRLRTQLDQVDGLLEGLLVLARGRGGAAPRPPRPPARRRDAIPGRGGVRGAGRPGRSDQRQEPDRSQRQRPGRRLGTGEPGADLPDGR